MRMLDSEITEARVQLELARQAGRDAHLRAYLAAAKSTHLCLEHEEDLSRRIDLIDALQDQCEGIAGLTNVPYLDVDNFVTGKDMRAAEALSLRVGRKVLERLGYDLP